MLSQRQEDKGSTEDLKMTLIYTSVIYQIPWICWISISWISVPFRKTQLELCRMHFPSVFHSTCWVITCTVVCGDKCISSLFATEEGVTVKFLHVRRQFCNERTNIFFQSSIKRFSGSKNLVTVSSTLGIPPKTSYWILSFVWSVPRRLSGKPRCSTQTVVWHFGH